MGMEEKLKTLYMDYNIRIKLNLKKTYYITFELHILLFLNKLSTDQGDIVLIDVTEYLENVYFKKKKFQINLSGFKMII